MKGFLTKLSKIFLFLILVLIPTQLGRHFWPEWSYVLGLRVDYLSPTLYLIDLFWLGLFILEVKKLKTETKKWFGFGSVLVLGFILANVILAQNGWVAFYRWTRVGQLVWYGWYIKRNKELVENFLVKIIPFWVGLESLLAVGQISTGGSLNGIWWWLGERSFSFNTIGIAQMSVFGSGLVRAYGTFSHPNSLAGFLLVNLILWWKWRDKVKNIWWWVIVWLVLVGIILTGSRTIWLLTLVLGLIFLLKSFKNRFPFLVLGGLLILVLAWIVNFNYPMENFLGGWDENGWIKRNQLNASAIGMVKQNPWFGVGLGNFLTKLPEFQKDNQIFWLQPVHNILLLVVSEIGWIGMIILIWMINKLFRNRKIDKFGLMIFGVVILSGMVDHYWFTLPQNMWLLVLMLGLI